MQNPGTNEQWSKVIVAKRPLLSIPWRELWRYRDLMFQIAKRDVSAQYKQTVLGPVWFVIQPLLATAVFSFLFGRMARLGTSGVPHFLFYMIGLVSWNFFADCVNKTAHTFTRNAHLFGKVYFPRLAVPLANAGTSLAAFGVQFCIFLIGMGFYAIKAKYFPDPLHVIHFDPNWRVFLLPFFLIQMAMLGLGLGLIISSLTIKYKDLVLGTGFLVQLMMYGSSVVFPLAKIKELHLQQLLALNPMVPIIEAMRLAFLGVGTVTQAQLLTSLITSAILLLAGIVMFNRAEQTAMDAV